MGTVTRLRSRAVTDLAEATRRFLDDRDFAPGTKLTYAETLDRLAEDLDGIALADITSDDITRHLRRRYGHTAPSTYNRHRATLGSLFTYTTKKRWTDENPVTGVERRRDRPSVEQAQRRRAVPYGDLERLWRRKDIPVRERTLWLMLFETAARANEILGLNVEDLDLDERCAYVDGKGHGAEKVFWATGTARLLPRLIGDRTTGPLFLAERTPTRPVAKADLDPDTGRARLSYRRAAELFTIYSGGLTLHQLRHSALTRLAEDGVDVALLKAKSRHRSLRSLERYVQPSDASVAKLTAAHDPAARRRG